MAERRRRGQGPADKRRNDDVDAKAAELDTDLDEEELDETELDLDETELDEDDLDEDDTDDDDTDDDDLDDDDLDEDADAEADDDEKPRRGSGRTATKTRPKSTAPAGRKASKAVKKRPGILVRFVNFIREIVAELRKVIWPTRKELLTYTSVVVLFVAVMITIVGLFDYGFARAVLWVFGNKTVSPTGQ